MHQLLLAMVTMCGILCMFASHFLPWFRFPVAGGSASSAEFPHICGASSPIVHIYQMATVVIVITTFVFWFLLPRRRQLSVACATAGLVFLLLFPYFQIVWQPKMAASASWLQIQHENLTWLGGDIFRGQEQISSPSRMQLYLSDSPRQVAVMKLPTWSFDELGLHQLPNMVEWLGYSNTFCQFMAAGWPLAVLGNVLILLATLFDRGMINILRIRTAVRAFVVMGLAGVAVAWFWPLWASYHLADAARATHRGDHDAALSCLRTASVAWPPLQEDTWFVAQLGLAEHMLGISSANADLHIARMLEKDMQFARAVSTYRQLSCDARPGSAVRREACRGMLRQSIRSLNSGELEKAVRGFRFVLRCEPCNIKALYGLQVVYRRLSDAASQAEAYAQLERVYHHLSFPDKNIVLGKTRELAVGTIPAKTIPLLLGAGLDVLLPRRESADTIRSAK